MTAQTVKDFVSWAIAHLPSMGNKPAEQVANAMAEVLLRLDPRLGVEVSDPNKGNREVIITAYSDPTLFPIVREIVEHASDISGWNFVALKPPRGFDFLISAGKHQLQANTLEFAPIADIDCGIQLLVPRETYMKLPPAENKEELAWLIVETGLGEELTSKLKHIEFAIKENVGERNPITMLGAFLKVKIPL